MHPFCVAKISLITKIFAKGEINKNKTNYNETKEIKEN
ncbi:hypothetical protein HMPREF1562_3343 [Providencia alcalifaciens F90-2004]|nr:hypothetical protein HMPREF1562_3343 [Providencia alcalifaciens F90-2004]